MNIEVWVRVIGVIFTGLNFLGVVIVGAFHWFSHNKIVGNDLYHLALDLKEIKDSQKTHGEKLEEFSKKVVDITARCEERHSKISYTRKKKIR